VADNPTLWAALTAAPNPAPIVRQRGVAVSDPSAANAFAVPEHDLALLFGVLPMTAGLFGFLIILVLIIAFTIWQISRREKEKINRTV